MSLREWLILGGALLVALILFDGWRRISGRRRRLKIDIDPSIRGIAAESGGHNPELPNGGARVKTAAELLDVLGANASNSVGDKLRDSAEIDTAVAEMNADIDREAALLSGLSARRDSDDLPEPTDTGEFISKPRVAKPNAGSVPESAASTVSTSNTSTTASDKPSSPLVVPLDSSTITPQSQSEEETEHAGLVDEAWSSEVPGYSEVDQNRPTAQLEKMPTSEGIESSDKAELEAVFEASLPVLEPDRAIVDGQNETPSDIAQEASDFNGTAAQLESGPLVSSQDLDIHSDSQMVNEPEAASLHEQVSTVDTASNELLDTPDIEDVEPKESSHEVLQDRREAQPGEIEDLFAIPDLDFDRPIHEILDMDLDDEPPVENRPKPNRKSRAKVSDQPTDSLFDTLLDQVDSAEDPPFDDIDSLVDQVKESTLDLAEVDVSKSDSVAVNDDHLEMGSADHQAAVSTGQASRQLRELDFSDPEASLAIFVVAPKGEYLSGSAIRQVAQACGMEFGQQNLFHRYEDQSDRSPIQFSMSDAVKPGYFDLSSLSEHQTPAISLFMSMSEPRDPMYAYECMLATAETLARNLKAELLDSDRSVLRSQTKEHYRERVSNFQLKKRASRRSR
jgi:cell division protein ZipA